MTKITFARHGETEENEAKIVQDQIGGKLTEKGREQTKKLAKRLSEEEFDAIYCSDSERTKETAKEIAKYHKTPIGYREELREINRGETIGISTEKLWKEFEKSRETLAEWKPNGGESPLEQQKRVEKFLKELVRKHQGQDVLLITHGGVCRSIWNLCNNTLPDMNHADKNKMENGSLSQLEVKNNQFKLLAYNSTEHLK